MKTDTRKTDARKTDARKTDARKTDARKTGTKSGKILEKPISLLPIGTDKKIRTQIEQLTYLHLASIYITFISLTYFFTRSGYTLKLSWYSLAYFFACLVGQIVLMVGISRINTLLLSDRNREDLYFLCLISLFLLGTAGLYLGSSLFRAYRRRS
jgi:hypothetical protein